MFANFYNFSNKFSKLKKKVWLLKEIYINKIKYNFTKLYLFFLDKIHNKKFNFTKLKKKQTDFTVIFGSDSSLNDLSPKEKKLISSSNVIFMNKNLIFWKLINIWPDYYFLSDTNVKSDKAFKIFIDSIKVIKNEKFNSPRLLLENLYKNYFYDNENFYFKTAYQSNNIIWAQNKNEKMFGFHGSLSTLLNVITVLNLGKKILLVGFNMNNKNYFFDKEDNFLSYTDKSFHTEESLHPNLALDNNCNNR